jgi:hypothetical protein
MTLGEGMYCARAAATGFLAATVEYGYILLVLLLSRKSKSERGSSNHQKRERERERMLNHLNVVSTSSDLSRCPW